MDKNTLYKIFSRPFNQQNWIEIMQSVFGVKNVLQRPAEIPLPSNDKAEAAYELGSFNTVDDRIIGLYLVKVKSQVWLERNKVGLRELLRSVYKYDVDGAIIVFEQAEKWRLSFVSDIKVLNDEGEVVEQATEPKRYTYLLGENQKVRTPADRLSKLVGKQLYLNDILNAFRVEALNEEFYKIVQDYFYQLVGGKIGKRTKISDFGDGMLQLPNTNREVRQEFVVRLIGRTVFCWFLKMKKSDDGKTLMPETLLSSVAVKQNTGYYHRVLERLFFQTLNTPMDERLSNLPQGTENIPFLNGGLFEPNASDFYRQNKQTGLNENNLGITDQWFYHFFEELEKYNFTIDENSVTEIEVSVDPEMLGRIFENLLAEIDPDSGETARKATGSFYTPREIVDYMATESLVQYLHNQTSINQEKLRPIFKMLETTDIEFAIEEKESILDALDKIKILDPACGSGAFPMGVLQKIVQALQKLDPDAVWWKKRQIKRISNAIVKKQLKEKLESSGVEYARKIGVIQNSLYGVDIQPIAAEISKLRCFLSLIVDETIDEAKPNRGIEPLPNLEFKFVTADTLIKLPEEEDFGGLFNSNDDVARLEELRNEYIQSYGKTKARIKEQFIKVQQKITKDQSGLWGDKNSKAYKLGNWNPFGHGKSDWFDPKWMFGVEKFDVVIGNPPYVDIKSLPNELVRKYFNIFETAEKRINLYSIFIERGTNFISPNGILTYINPNSLLVNESYKKIRLYIIDDLIKIIKLPDSVFRTATVETIILILSKGIGKKELVNANFFKNNDKIDFNSLNFEVFNKSVWKKEKGCKFSIFTNSKTQEIIDKIELNTTPLFKLADFSLGITPYDRYKGHSSELISNRSFHSERKLSDEYVPLISGKNIHRYFVTDEIKEFLKYGDWLGAPREKRFFEDKKIIVRQILDGAGLKIIAAYSEVPRYFTQIGFSIVGKSNSVSLKKITAILNSSLMTFYHRAKFLDVEKVTFAKILIANCKQFPIKSSIDEDVFDNLIDEIRFILKLPESNLINDQVPNTHIAQLFEEVIDAMAMELYFKEDFEKAGIEFIKYAERDFESIEGKPEEEAIQIIQAVYQKLREKDNEIRNNLKLMDIKLADIVMPIKNAK